MNFDLMLTDEEYQKRFYGGDYSVPYVYELTSRNRVLVYFGVEHSRDPHNIQWEKLRLQWADFLKNTKGPRVVFFEGEEFPEPNEKNLQDIVSKYGETGALLYFLGDSGAETVWPDIAINEEARQLTEKFEPNIVAYYIFVRSLGSWLRAGTMGTFDEVAVRAASTTSHRISGASSDVSTYAATHEQIFGKVFDEKQREVITRASAPVYHDSIINDVARASSRIRNEHVLNKVEQYWRKGYNVFLLFGSAHAAVQEPVLRDMIEKDRSR